MSKSFIRVNNGWGFCFNAKINNNLKQFIQRCSVKAIIKNKTPMPSTFQAMILSNYTLYHKCFIIHRIDTP
jgi:hypothetical protein